MVGETNLNRLLTSMQPVLRDGDYVFCSIPLGVGYSPALDPVGYFKEEEGLTLILPQHQAEAAGLHYPTVFALITLSVHSSLEAVGFLAAIATKLASHGISVNPVSAFYHDHLFVLVAQAEAAIALLHELAAESGTTSP